MSFWKIVLQYFLLRRKSTHMMFMDDFIMHTKMPAWVLQVSRQWVKHFKDGHRYCLSAPRWYLQIASTETRGKLMGLIRENQNQGNGSRDWNRALCTPAEGAEFGKSESLCPLGFSLADRKAQISEREKKLPYNCGKVCC